jgi:hypothetical protein
VAAPPPGGLQPGDFLPIDRDNLLKQGEEVRRTTAWMWFGRRDIIPPVSDPRTKLIDRGMLTQGLLSAEELAEMHQVGDEWSRHANRVEHIQVQAARSAEAAVEADRAARAARKAQKKAEAAERKRRHAEAVARRKATDIVRASPTRRRKKRSHSCWAAAALGISVYQARQKWAYARAWLREALGAD